MQIRFRRALLTAALLIVAGRMPVMCQSWTALASQPPSGIDLCLLLTDGGVMCQAALINQSAWYKLTPDSAGSYRTGTWSTLAPMPSGYVPLAFASAVLADGRLAVIGGEYNNGVFALTNMGAIYDPGADSWTMIPAPPFGNLQCIGDAPSTVLADGRLIIGSKLFQDLAILDPADLSWTHVAPAGKKDPFNSEEGWTLLPDGSFLALDVKNGPAAERFLLNGANTGIRSEERRVGK